MFALIWEVTAYGAIAASSAVRVGALEVARVPVHAEPLGVHVLDDRQQLLGGADDASVVLERQNDAARARVGTRLPDGLDAPLPRLRLGGALLHVAREDADGRRAQFGRAIDPALRVGHLLVALRAGRVRERVADGGARDGEPQQEGAPAQLPEIGVRHRLGHVVGGQLHAVERILRAEVDETLERHRTRLGRLAAAVVRQVIPERVRGKAQLHPRAAGALDGVETQRGYGQQRQACGGRDGLREIST